MACENAKLMPFFPDMDEDFLQAVFNEVAVIGKIQRVGKQRPVLRLR